MLKAFNSFPKPTQGYLTIYQWIISVGWSIQVRFTTKQRTAASAIAFVDGLFGTGMGLEFPEALEDDMLIKVIS